MQTTRTNHGATIPLPEPDEEAIRARKVREVLDYLDNVLVKGDNVAESIWNVLSALRGPDNAGYGDKCETTNAIRVTAFPRTADADNKGGISLPASFYSPEYSERTLAGHVDYEAKAWHFSQHIRSAAEVLGLRE